MILYTLEKHCLFLKDEEARRIDSEKYPELLREHKLLVAAHEALKSDHASLKEGHSREQRESGRLRSENSRLSEEYESVRTQLGSLGREFEEFRRTAGPNFFLEYPFSDRNLNAGNLNPQNFIDFFNRGGAYVLFNTYFDDARPKLELGDHYWWAGDHLIVGIGGKTLKLSYKGYGLNYAAQSIWPASHYVIFETCFTSGGKSFNEKRHSFHERDYNNQRVELGLDDAGALKIKIEVLKMFHSLIGVNIPFQTGRSYGLDAVALRLYSAGTDITSITCKAGNNKNS